MVMGIGRFSVLLFISTLFLSGCANVNSTKLKTDTCSNPVIMQGQFSAEAAYGKMNSCIREGNLHQAAVLFAYAGTKTWYEAEIHPDVENRNRHKSLLSMALGQLDNTEKRVFWDYLKALMSSEESVENICQEIEYVSSNNILNYAIWKKSVNMYLNCERDIRIFT